MNTENFERAINDCKIVRYKGSFRSVVNRYHELEISRLEALVKAADEVIEQFGFEPTMSGSVFKPRQGYKKFNEALESYNKLKSIEPLK